MTTGPCLWYPTIEVIKISIVENIYNANFDDFDPLGVIITAKGQSSKLAL